MHRQFKQSDSSSHTHTLTFHLFHTVNSFSPYPEPAGLDPVSKFAAIQGPLHDYGSYIVSCALD